MGRILYPAALLLLWAGTVMADSQERSADDTFRTAERLYNLRRYDEAEPHFAGIATICQASPRGECGLYYLAECQYQQKKYIAAFDNDEYARL
jgi:TolA-binding protein